MTDVLSPRLVPSNQVNVLPSFDYSGTFENDYKTLCQKNQLNPFRIAKYQPYHKSTAQPTLISSKSSLIQPIGSVSTSKAGSLTSLKREFHPYEPELVLESWMDDEEVEYYRVHARGFKLSLKMFQVMGGCISACNQITKVSFYNCGLQEEHVPILLAVVGNTNNLVELYIDYNPIGNGKLFSQLLTVDDTNLRLLSLRGNEITDDGAYSIATSLRSNRNLFALNLWGNKIGRDGAKALAEALKINNCLGSLNLGKNMLNDAGAISLAKVLQRYNLSAEEFSLRKKISQDLSKRDDERSTKSRTSALEFGRFFRSASRASVDSISNRNLKKNPSGSKTVQKSLSKTMAAPPVAAKKEETKGKAVPAPNVSNGPRKSTSTASAKGAPPPGKKGGKTEDIKEEPDEDVNAGIDFAYEQNGQWTCIGNRSLCSLNLSANNLSEATFRTFVEVINEQDAVVELVSDVSCGLMRLALQYNDISDLQMSQLNHALAHRNPYLMEHNAETASKPNLASEAIPEEKQ